MGSASRENQNIFRVLKEKGFKRAFVLLIKYDKNTHIDTIMPLICKIKGHKPYHIHDKEDNLNYWACKRCQRYINEKDVMKQKIDSLLK